MRNELMVKDFQLTRLPFIYFKTGKLAELPGIVKRFGNTILLVTGKSSFMNSQHAVHLLEEFRENDITFHHISVPGEPSPGLVDQTTERFKHVQIEAVVGIGGGSVIDAGKAISAVFGLS